MSANRQQIINLQSGGLIPISDSSGYLHNGSSIFLKCPKGHLHDYFFSECGGLVLCKTCSRGNKFTKRVREILEKITGVPFIIEEKSRNGIILRNRLLKIAVCCESKKQQNTSVAPAGTFLLHNSANEYLFSVAQTTSNKKIKEQINYNLFMKEDLPLKIRKKILLPGQLKNLPSASKTKLTQISAGEFCI